MRKGEATRQAILEHAVDLASRVGLAGITIGGLADGLGLSKSGLFAHFQSKDALQIQVLEAAASRFVDLVVRPALKAPRGEPRVRALFDQWLAWGAYSNRAGGCVFVAAAMELDDQPGPVREALVRTQRDWLDTLATAVRIAIAEKHFRPDVEPDQFAFAMYGIMFAVHHAARLMQDERADAFARATFETLLRDARGK